MWKWSDLKRLLTKRELDTRKLGAIMWPAVYPVVDGYPEYRPREPHCTIIYFGEIDGDIGFTKEDVIEAIKETDFNVFLWADVTGQEWFGPEQNIPVLTLNHSMLFTYHDQILAALQRRGIPFDNTYPIYKPHVTITDEAALDKVYPRTIMLAPVELWWGGEHIQIPLDGRLDIP